MNSVICTLVEGHYHYGLVALVNSLFKQGFRGEFFVGYRGELPPWASSAILNKSISWDNVCTYEVNIDLKIHFLPIETSSHFANYKPNFMLQLLAGPAKKSDQIFYFDPDIVVVRSWFIFEEWVGQGVIALCEDVNSPLAKYHPRRMAWRNYFLKNGIILNFKEALYANSGFIGLRSCDYDFLELWIKIQETIALSIGGLEYAPFMTGGKMLSKEDSDDYAPFSKTDQDALNATIEAWDGGKIGFIGQEGMAFKSGARLMSHALGNPKPWKENIFLSTIQGNSPGFTLKDYWENTNTPISSQSKMIVKLRLIEIKISALIGRFYRRR